MSARRPVFLRIVFLSMALLVPVAVHAADDLMGKQLRGTGEAPIGNASGGTIDAVVGAGVEYSGLWCCNVIDVSATQITVDFTQSNGFSLTGGFNGFVFRDVTNNIDAFHRVSLNPASNITPAGLSFNGNEIFLNMNGKSFSGSSVLILDVIIPEPSSIALLGFGLVTVCGCVRGRRRARA